MTKLITARDLGRPPGICELCWNEQTNHALDEGGGAFHCHHNNTQAIVKAELTGWLIETGVSREEYIRRAESAATT